LARRDPAAVKKFSTRHQDRLPARVLREVRNVLDSGVKRPSRQHHDALAARPQRLAQPNRMA
jgi:hypothetical protein